MKLDRTDLDWLAERLPEVAPHDDQSTARARQALLRHLSAAALESTPQRGVPWGLRARRRFGFGLLTAGVAAAAVVAINFTGGHSADSTAVASAATIKARALHALTPTGGSILEIAVTITQTDSYGPSYSFGYQLWSSTRAPYAERAIQTASQSPSTKSAQLADGRQQLYDASTNTIYSYAPQFDFKPGRTMGTKTLTVADYKLERDGGTPPGATLPAADTGTTTLTLTASQVREMKIGVAQISYRKLVLHRAPEFFIASRPFLQGPRDTTQIDGPAQFTRPIVKVLDDPSATVNRSATYEGRPAIEITVIAHNNAAELKAAHNLKTTYWVAPGSYRPLQEVRTSVAPIVGKPTVYTTTVTKFPVWKTLTGTTRLA